MEGFWAADRVSEIDQSVEHWLSDSLSLSQLTPDGSRKLRLAFTPSDTFNWAQPTKAGRASDAGAECGEKASGRVPVRDAECASVHSGPCLASGAAPVDDAVAPAQLFGSDSTGQQLCRAQSSERATRMPQDPAERAPSSGSQSVASWLVLSTADASDRALGLRLVALATLCCFECSTSNEYEFDAASQTPRTCGNLVCQVCGHEREKHANDVVRRVRDAAWHLDETFSKASTAASPRLHVQTDFAGSLTEWDKPGPEECLQNSTVRQCEDVSRPDPFSHKDTNPLLIKRELELLMDFGNSPVMERHKQRISAQPRGQDRREPLEVTSRPSRARRLEFSNTPEPVPLTVPGRARTAAIVSGGQDGAKGYL